MLLVLAVVGATSQSAWAEIYVREVASLPLASGYFHALSDKIRINLKRAAVKDYRDKDFPRLVYYIVDQRMIEKANHNDSNSEK